MTIEDTELAGVDRFLGWFGGREGGASDVEAMATSPAGWRPWRWVTSIPPKASSSEGDRDKKSMPWRLVSYY